MTTTPNAKIICDSISPEGSRLITVQATCHRFILAELNTHRVFSRNSASSRAIPIQKQMDRVMSDPAFPLEFGTNQKGMQAGEPLVGDELIEAQMAWEEASHAALHYAARLLDLGVHKQVTNRLLEPFMWHTVVITSTEWEGFFHQRSSRFTNLAQPEIMALADAIYEVIDDSVPEKVGLGEWHLPYVRGIDEDSIDPEDAPKISAARCARVSYLTQEGKRDVDADMALFERLSTASPPHASPLEHVATPAFPLVSPLGNLRGWDQLRHRYFS